MESQNRARGTVAEAHQLAARVRQAWQMVGRRHKWTLAATALIMACASASDTILPLLLGKLVDAIQQGTRESAPPTSLYRVAAWYLALIGGSYALREGMHVARHALVIRTCTRIHRDTVLQLMTHLLTVPLATLSRDKVGAMHGRIVRGADGLVRFLRLNFLDFIPALLTGLFAWTAVLSKQPVLGGVMLGVAPLSVWLTVRQIVSQKEVRRKLMRSCEEIDGAIVEQLGGIEYVRAAHTHQQEVSRLAEATERRRMLEVKHHVQMCLFSSAKALNEGAFHILVLACSVYLAISGRITVGDVLTFSFLFLGVMRPLGEIHRLLDEGHESSLQVGDLLDMLAEPMDASFVTPSSGSPQLESGRSAIVVENLCVNYATPNEKRARAVDDVSLTIRHGETIGVAGRSGSGKSTFIKVLLRLVHPQGGNVLLGDTPLEAVSRQDIGRLFGYVGQSPFVFAGTIADNIAYGNGRPAPDAIRRAAEMACLHEEIMAMPGAYEALVTERGQNLSGGQRQRLALARILLRQPPILILDEATAALDNISERRVQRSLGLRSVDRTTILVAHRLSTLRDADRIFVFHEGRVAEVGKYADLVAAGGIFRELVLSAENGV
jgi:ATP-binding cassette subfamily B protein